MSIFGNIMDKIRGNAARADAAANQPTGIDQVRPAGAADTNAAAAPKAAPISSFDVEARMEELSQATGHKTNWRESIVDLMSLLGIDSDITNRRALAHELGYTGDLNDSATMNVWLHRTVMQKLAENGGKVPANLSD